MINALSGIQQTSAALTAERVRMDVIGQNIANANTTRGPDGKPYERRQVTFETVLNQAAGETGSGIIQARISADPRAPRRVYEPGNPDADARGMVELPNINVHEEMADLIAASRGYEANLAVVRNARQMALQTLAIGKR